MASLFFCHACLDDKDQQELSPDPHYCQGCCDFLLKEAETKGIDAVYWTDPYPKNKDKELQSYATCVIDGHKWKVAPSGRNYCSGKVKELKNE